MKLLKEKETVCRQGKHPKGLTSALFHEARLLAFDLARAKEALPLAEEAQRLAKQHRLSALGEQIEAIMQQIRALAG